MRSTKKIILNFYLVVFFTLILLALVLFLALRPQFLQFYVFDVGQGDAIFIRTPHHYQILIDGGPDNLVLYKLGEYLPFYERDIDLVVLTHPDNDHLVGLDEVLKRYNVKAVLLTGITDESPAYLNLQRIIGQRNISVLIAGQVRKITVEPNINLEILYPTSSLAGQKFKEKNDSSIVARLNYKNFSVLLTGDAPQDVEKKLIKTEVDFSADILKIAHHGSSASSDSGFLAGVKPNLAIISVGQNKFGHPSAAVLTRLSQQNILYFTTLEQGDVIVCSDGQKFWLK